MITVGMLCHTPCPSCQEPIPVNALVDTLVCSGCSQVVRLSGPGLTQLLATALRQGEVVAHQMDIAQQRFFS